MPGIRVNPITGDVGEMHSVLESFVSTIADPNNLISINMVKNEFNGLITAFVVWFDPSP